ncbi:MAG: phosphoribosylaminoimidazolesuccinocarboxamide synthase [Tepidanaerobacter acetatoxydans]|uniref:phosphoribosylaminoimidazolesuccinocarboxamide synthase n=1 Tax=Tepidanaerobacter acetatoxydans (strain DSM 21804 / JCM 16047 / Re1) TaxID=1209989 RepID=F4LSX5_TEPAE|nr:phosphoribosylaminoimidazolesuccinocarboxamide synthase [Tepidanaerobacter acetatoxydans]AEE90438.1 SAICAR synthetase [Tepidanaerobacter acetatoxydans Re1]NLU10359.1 phosphoribosylaminoimidazolesuccinocarboxamide synthase [Tepidanaerobacter acetatoxydans]CCP24932.1 Phosphoribosylaminoimidazole-succinocarboxamide synthase [Tepidanaerobacter acetatoxydans Re1]
MEKIREGKTKTVFDTGDGNILLKFRDDVTGTGDVVDPGANTVIGKIEGKGNASLKLSKHFFELLKRDGIRTHYIDADLKENTMLVKRADTFGDGLEFICRLKAAGSFVRRYGRYVEEDQPLDYLVEITLKDDDRGDPLINEEALVQLKLMTKEEVSEAIALTKKITKIVKQECERFDLELIDIKFEFARVEGEIAVIDEISGDNMRVRKNGQAVMQKELCDIICGK